MGHRGVMLRLLLAAFRALITVCSGDSNPYAVCGVSRIHHALAVAEIALFVVYKIWVFAMAFTWFRMDSGFQNLGRRPR